jgi:RNA polymerase sigma-70 factor (ECF subfamily)
VGQGDGTDGEVVRAVLAGDRERFRILVRRYRDRYARYAARMLGSTDAAEDAVQEAFVRAYEQLRQCRDPENFVGWFFLILRNRCLAERRRGRNTTELAEAAELPSPERTEHAVEANEERRALDAALAALTPEQREVFVLKHIEGWSYEDIARHTGLSVGSLKMRMHRGYDRLRESLRALWDGMP